MFFNYSKGIIGREFELGGCTAGGGLDCFTMLREHLKSFANVEIPLDEVYHGLTFKSYPEVYKKSPAHTMTIAIRYLDLKLDKRQNGRFKTGDIFLLQTKITGKFHFGIYAGNSKVIIADPNDGIACHNLSLFRVKEIWATK